MQLVIDEPQQKHLYQCLKEGAKAYNKQKKGAESLELPTDRIEEELEINRQLRRMVNPHGDEDAGEKKDGRQLDIEDEIEGATETGGATRTHLNTGDAATDLEIRDQLRAIHLTVALRVIHDWQPEVRAGVETWIGQVVAANTLGGTIPDEPDAISRDTVPNERVKERLDAGPYTVIERDGEFEVEHTGTHTVKIIFDDVIDAQLEASERNADAIALSDMSEQDEHRWAAAGPWSVVMEGEAFWIVAGREREFVDEQREAFALAARYNRSIAQRGNGEGWTEPPPPKVDDHAVQELQAAEEAGESVGPQDVYTEEGFDGDDVDAAFEGLIDEEHPLDEEV
jgi:hypothetical protein